MLFAMVNFVGEAWAQNFSGWRFALTHLLLLQDQPQSLWQRAWHYIAYEFTFGKITVSIATLVLGILVLLLAILISHTVRSFVERRLSERTIIDPGIQYTVLRLIHYILIAVGTLLALKIAFELDLTSVAIVFSALSFGIGFGLQFIAGDIAAGFILLFERPVRVGDFITITGPDSKLTEGRVQSINLRTTVVITNDQIAAIVPNSKLVNQNLINWSYRERRSRISIPVGVSYDADVDLVTKTLREAADGVEFLLEDPKPKVQFLGFGESSLSFRLLVWTARPRRHMQIKSDINYRIHRLFKERKIEIPYPQRDLNVRVSSLSDLIHPDLEAYENLSEDDESQPQQNEETAANKR